jgi:hypothetical protein
MAFRMHHSHQHYQLLDEAPGLNPIWPLSMSTASRLECLA